MGFELDDPPEVLLPQLCSISYNMTLNMPDGKERHIIGCKLGDFGKRVFGQDCNVYNRDRLLTALRTLASSGRVVLFGLAHDDFVIEYVLPADPVPAAPVQPSELPAKPKVDYVGIWRKLQAEKAAAGKAGKPSLPNRNPLLDLIDL